MERTAHSLAAEIASCMLADRHRFRRRLRQLEGAGGRGVPARDSIERLAAEVQRSRARLERRRASLPRPRYPLDLPVVERREDIGRAIADHQVVVVCGETGSGKTTQLPKICLELGRGVAGMIGHTQPRRIAARSIAARIASELESPLGQAVGYKVRFADQLSPDTYIKVMTDGILLAETQGDRFLEQYDTIIIDEAHERSLNIDFLLGYLRQLLPRRPDLKVIITSATINPQRFAEHFADAQGRPAPILEVSGRTYPVEVLYRPLKSEGQDAPDASNAPDAPERDMLDAIVEAVEELGRLEPSTRGDTLVFLSGEREIRDTAEALRRAGGQGRTESLAGRAPAGQARRLTVLPLYARLSAEEQNRVFRPEEGGPRRVVLATNVAETSLTVPGIRYVVDPGLARISRYSTRTKVQRLPIEPISRASADQRKGRCGRVAPGVCVRLYSERDYLGRPEFTDPEILRTNLASVILQMKALRLGNVEDFPFIDPPEPRHIRDGYQTLHELGAVDADNELTPLGRELARLPIDPRIGRMILAARDEGCMHEVLIIAAALSIQDPRERPLDRQQQADEAHAQFRDERSDFLGYLKLWEAYHEQLRTLSKNQVRKWCQQSFLSAVRMREWLDIHAQLHRLVTEMELERKDLRGPAPRREGAARGAWQDAEPSRPRPAPRLGGLQGR